MGKQIVPFFLKAPEGFTPIRQALLPQVTALDAVRAANVCQYEASRIHNKLARGLVPDTQIAKSEVQIVSLRVMDRTLATLCGALRAVESEEARAAARRLLGTTDAAQAPAEVPLPFTSIGDAVARVVGGLDEESPARPAGEARAE